MKFSSKGVLGFAILMGGTSATLYLLAAGAHDVLASMQAAHNGSVFTSPEVAMWIAIVVTGMAASLAIAFYPDLRKRETYQAHLQASSYTSGKLVDAVFASPEQYPDVAYAAKLKRLD